MVWSRSSIVLVDTEYDVIPKDIVNTARLLSDFVERRHVSLKTAWQVWIKMKLLPEDFDPEEEIELLKEFIREFDLQDSEEVVSEAITGPQLEE